MKEEFIFPLARFTRFLNAQKAELLIFGEEAVKVKSRGKLLQEFPFENIDGLKFIQAANVLPDYLHFLGFNSLIRSEPRIEIKTKEGVFLYSLELDARYRKNEIRSLLELLYKKGLPLTETTAIGRKTFLLELVGEEEIMAGINRLKENG